ncbi:MAG: hypothetical protein K2O18_02485 [Oscillospiraceae bacterium]|nr:hypothetical protein [Oscillospiraceae bacterium]
MKHKLFIAVILLLCLLPAAGMFAVPQGETGGNEILSPPPALRDSNGKLNTGFLPDLSAYVEDNYQFRQTFVTAWSYLNQKFLHTSIASGVVLGKDGWLYFSDTLEDYTGLGLLTPREIFAAAHNLSLVSEYCQTQGAQFLFTVAPNKNSLYPEHMPDLTVYHSVRNADALAAALDAEGVPYVNLFDAFREQSETLYFTQDSHWNSKGAALAADKINAALHRETQYYAGPFTPDAVHSGDLYAMLYPTGKRLETDQTYSSGFAFTYDAPIRDASSLTIMTAGPGTGSLLMFRDSFGNLLYPYMAESFQNALFSRSMPYKLDLIAQRNADFAVAELVERNLDYLVQNVPVMPAPERDVTLFPNMDILPVKLEADTASSLPGCVLVRGTLPVQPDEKSPVYLRTDAGCWEAFLLQDNAFALYIPETAQSAENISVVFAASAE